MNKFLHRRAWFALLGLLTACGQPAPESPPSALVEVQPAQTRTLEQTLEAYGTLEFAPADAATLAVQVESRVAELLVTTGQPVVRGQPLLRLAPSPATRLELDKARRDAELAAVERARMRRLRDEGLATESELQAAVNAAATARSLRDSLERRVGPDGVHTLVAPRDGIVDALTVQPGDVLPAGAAAVRVAAPDALQLRLGIELEDLPRVAVGQTARLSALNRAAPAVSATVSAIDRRIDPQTRLAAALLRVRSAAGLLPGEVLRAQIVLATHADAVAVPRAALLYAGERTYLFVAAGGKAQRRDVQAGLQQHDLVEIVAGLKAGEPVIVAGNSVLEDGMAIRTQAAP